MIARAILAVAILTTASVSVIGAQTRLQSRDVANALKYFGLVQGNTIQLGGFHYIQSVQVIDRGNGEFDVRFKTTPVVSR